VFVASEEAVWTAVVQPPLPENWERAELVTFTPQEVRLFAAVFLSEADPFENGAVSPQLWTGRQIPIDGPDPDLSSENFLASVPDMLERLRKDAGESDWAAPQREGPYILQDTGTLQDAQMLLESVQTDDQLLLAGLYRLLSGLRLHAERQFLEEAFVQFSISLSAALEFIRLVLEEREGRQQRFEHVYAYFRETFWFGDPFSDWLEWMYELRVMAFHPASRYGEAWVPPVMVGMAYELQKWLTIIYRHIILGELPVLESQRRGTGS
jgi:hypothetical protein